MGAFCVCLLLYHDAIGDTLTGATFSRTAKWHPRLLASPAIELSVKKKVGTSRHLAKLNRCLKNGRLASFGRGFGAHMEQWPLELRYSESRNITFVHIYKNAGTAINQLLNQEKGGFEYLERWHPQGRWHQALRAKIVAFVRDPIDRLLSGYYEIMLRRFVQTAQWSYLKKFPCLELISVNGHFDRLATFKAFITCYGPRRLEQYEDHVLPQAAFLLNKDATNMAANGMGYRRLFGFSAFLIDSVDNIDSGLEQVLGHKVKLPLVHHLKQVHDERFKFPGGVSDLPADVLSVACSQYGSHDYCCLDIRVRRECVQYVHCNRKPNISALP